MKISVITPIYNGEIHLDEFVKNSKAITYKDVEFIFIDNNSTDNSVNKLKELLRETDLTYTILEENKQGAGHARNTGIKIAKGTYLAFIDCDDSVESVKFQNDIDILQNNDVDFVFCRALRTYHDGRIIKHPIEGIKLGINNPPDLGLIWLKNYFHLQGPGSIIIKKEVVEKLGGFHTSLTGEDAFLFIRLGLTHKGYFYDETYFNYYRHPQSTVSTVNQEKCGRLRSYFNLRKDLYNDDIVLNNPVSKKIVTCQLQMDILDLNRNGYSIKELMNDEKLKKLKLSFFIFNPFSLLINRWFSKKYNPFYRLWIKMSYI